MRPLLLTAAMAALPFQAAAFECRFPTECYEDEPCTQAGFDIEVDIEGKTIGTEFGDLVIVAVKETGALTTMFATGAGAEYMLSLTPEAARLSSHANAGPQVISYLGRCEWVQ